MRDFTSCFGENGVQIADSSSSSSNSTRNSQNLVTSVYKCRLRGRSCLITIIWSKNLMGQGFSVEIEDHTNQCLCKVEIKPWLFSKKKGSKNQEIDSHKLDIYWDLSSANFGSGPEPLDGFYLAIIFDRKMVLLLGDLRKEAFKKTNINPIHLNTDLILKKEHIHGKKLFITKAQFCKNGQIHDLVVECDTNGVHDPCLLVRIDCKTVIRVKRLKWTFRGNNTILIDGISIEVYWDVHNWLFGSSLGSAVFMFKTYMSDEKSWANANQPMYDPSMTQVFADSQSHSLGFSLILYAWKNE